MTVFDLLIPIFSIAIAVATINTCLLGLFSRLRSDAELECDGVLSVDELKALYATDPMRCRLHRDRIEFIDTGKSYVPATTRDFLDYDSWR